MKNRYIQMRNQKIIDWNFLYDYVVSKGFNLGVEAFNVGAQSMFLQMAFILERIDSDFELTILNDKQGNFIKVIT